jgi:hypothetical protein
VIGLEFYLELDPLIMDSDCVLEELIAWPFLLFSPPKLPTEICPAPVPPCLIYFAIMSLMEV